MLIFEDEDDIIAIIFIVSSLFVFNFAPIMFER